MPPARMRHGNTTDRAVQRDLTVLIDFIGTFCLFKHSGVCKSLARLKGVDLEGATEKHVSLCPDCAKLLAHAVAMRLNCPMKPKPSCKHCPKHCYHPTYREQMREVMKYSGRRLVLSGRLSYLFHLLF